VARCLSWQRSHRGICGASTGSFSNALTRTTALCVVALKGGPAPRDRVRRLAKFLNLYGGVCLLDCLTQTDIIKLLGDELVRILENENQNQKKKVAKVKV
jgi:hypothetical protein